MLLGWKRRSAGELVAAQRTVDAFEASDRYEERGEVEGKPFYYSNDTYPRLKIVVYGDGVKITDVEEIKRGRSVCKSQ